MIIVVLGASYVQSTQDATVCMLTVSAPTYESVSAPTLDIPNTNSDFLYRVQK